MLTAAVDERVALDKGTLALTLTVALGELHARLGDGGEMVGRWWGDGGEMVGRWWGDGGQVGTGPGGRAFALPRSVLPRTTVSAPRPASSTPQPPPSEISLSSRSSAPPPRAATPALAR